MKCHKKCNCICHMLATKYLYCPDCECMMCTGCSKIISKKDREHHGKNCEKLKIVRKRKYGGRTK